MKKLFGLGIVTILIIGFYLYIKNFSGPAVTIGVNHNNGKQDSYQIENGKSKWTGSSNDTLSEAPKGFSWVTCANLGGAKFLQPEGWYKTEFQEPGEEEQKCFITKNDFNKTKTLSTGLLVVATKNANKKFGVKASEVAYQFVEEKKKDLYNSYEILEADLDPFYMRSIHIKIKDTISFIRALGNDNTGTVYTVTFVTPEREFLIEKKNNFPLSGPMTQRMNLEDTY